MTTRSRQRSPLAMVVLALLLEAPMHVYRMHELIRQRGKDSVVNVAQRNSVYQTIARLLGAELIRVQETSQQEGRPERVVYALTEAGAETLHEWLAAMLAEPGRDFPEFPAALATIMVLSPAVAQAQLEQRRTALERQLAENTAMTEAVLARGLPRLFLLEDDYRQTLWKAEIAWLGRLIGELRSGEISWDEEWLRGVAAAFEG